MASTPEKLVVEYQYLRGVCVPRNRDPMTISPRQFEQAHLPGMPEPLKSAPETKKTFHDESARKYSGPIPGQLVMGTHNLGGDALGHPSRGWHQEPFYVADRTGMIQEIGDSGPSRPLLQRAVSPVDIEAKHNVRKTVNYYKTYGGAHADNDHVQDHWASQPLHHIPSDAPVHTGQDPRETLWGGDATAVHRGRVPEHEADGRRRVDAIRSSLQGGESIKSPAWLLKRAGRLYALDGHHRILAAREEGHATYPARVWDLDAEERAEKKAGF